MIDQFQQSKILRFVLASLIPHANLSSSPLTMFIHLQRFRGTQSLRLILRDQELARVGSTGSESPLKIPDSPDR